MKYDFLVQEFLNRFNQEYDNLYNCNDYVAGFGEALEFREHIIETQPEFVSEFIRYRQDVLSSDREIAAFGFVLSDMLAENYKI